MRKKIFRTVALTMAVIKALAMVIVILIVNHPFITVEENRMDTEAQLAAEGVAYGGENYLKSLAPHSYRLTWIDQDG